VSLKRITEVREVTRRSCTLQRRPMRASVIPSAEVFLRWITREVITDPASVLAFVAALQAHPLFRQHGRVDILANNAGRVVLGE
jgi:NAD(P)-dependent dehydrogenase (short-subunit alcohol dehydrogenase family)